MKLTYILLFLLSASNLSAEEVTLISYNVYFNDESGKTRYPGIISYLTSKKPDVIALQEVTPTFFKALSTSELSDYYFTPESPIGSYCNLILSKNKPDKYGVKKLESGMGRHAVYADIKLLNKTIRFINVHLESLDFPASIAFRKKQIESVSSLLQKYSILAGDFNFFLNSKYYDGNLRNLTDAAKGSNDARQVTYDIESNTLAQSTAEPKEQSRRLDRFYISPLFTNYSYSIEKTKNSDHYPILLTIRTDNQKTPAK